MMQDLQPNDIVNGHPPRDIKYNFNTGEYILYENHEATYVFKDIHDLVQTIRLGLYVMDWRKKNMHLYEQIIKEEKKNE